MGVWPVSAEAAADELRAIAQRLAVIAEATASAATVRPGVRDPRFVPSPGRLVPPGDSVSAEATAERRASTGPVAGDLGCRCVGCARCETLRRSVSRCSCGSPLNGEPESTEGVAA